MSTLDGQDLFASGPHEVRVASPQREAIRRGFPGLDGELHLDLGERGRAITQTGRLSAESACDLQTLLEQISAFVDGNSHTLIDTHGRTHANVLLETFEPTTPIRSSRGVWCDYQIHYRQLP